MKKINISICLFIIFICSCAKHDLKIAKQMPQDFKSFRALAYVVAEKGNIKWASNVVISVRPPDSLRVEALERITDIVASVTAKGNKGTLQISPENKKREFAGVMWLPLVGEVDIDPVTFAGVLVGRPLMDGNDGSIETEFDPHDRTPLSLTKFTPDKKRIIYEASFDDFAKVGGKKYPKHVILRFEHPKFLMELKYKEIKVDR